MLFVNSLPSLFVSSFSLILLGVPGGRGCVLSVSVVAVLCTVGILSKIVWNECILQQTERGSPHAVEFCS